MIDIEELSYIGYMIETRPSALTDEQIAGYNDHSARKAHVMEIAELAVAEGLAAWTAAFGTEAPRYYSMLECSDDRLAFDARTAYNKAVGEVFMMFCDEITEEFAQNFTVRTRYGNNCRA